MPSMAITAKAGANELESQFKNPPDHCRSIVIWEWCNGKVNRSGITADLEAMKRAGLGGVRLANVGGIEGPVRFASKEWFELMAFSCQEAGRLGLELGFNITEGFTAAGGPWITPEKSMQTVTWNETDVTGPGPLTITLEKPEFTPKGPPLKLKVDFYRDIRVFAVPKIGKSRITHYEGKSGFLEHHYDAQEVETTTPPESIPAGDRLRSSDVIEISEYMDKNGKLNWNVPKGEWTIIRMGAVSTGACTRPGSEKTRGLEVDKLDREAVRFHFDHLCKPLLEMEGVEPGKNLVKLAVDSWEADAQNWSPVLPAEFKKRRGYSLYPFMPVLTGRVVDSIEMSERFLWDYRRTIADCIYENFYLFLQESCEEYGMTFEGESFSRAAFDGMETTEAIGMPCATFWQGNSWSRASREGKWAASAAHVTGRQVVSSEAFPAGRKISGWINHPWTLKWLGDYAYASGVNQLGFHCFAMQPWDETNKAVYKPGNTFRHWGVQYSRHNTWWGQGVDWQKYQTRCQFMLQQGMFQAEAIFMTPEVVPGQELLMARRVNLSLGYDWDMASARMIKEKMFVKDGLICLPSGMKYHILVLSKMSEITVPLLTKLKDLIAAGAHVLVSSRPDRARGLTNYPKSDKKVTDMVGEIWQNLDGKKGKEQVFGKGKLYWGYSAEQVLNKLGVSPDVIVEAEGPNKGKLPINYIHRYTPEADIYFVSSSLETPSSGLLSFRITDKQPELWHPDTGHIEACPVYEVKKGRTIVPLLFDPCGSVFVVFRNKAASVASVKRVSLDGKTVLTTTERNNPVTVAADFFRSGGVCTLEMSDQKKIERTIAARDVRSLDTDWTVSFKGVGEAPAETRFEKLVPWNEHNDETIRYFSGSALYRKTFDVTKKKDQRVWLDLGKVEVIATVIVNGKNLGIQWKPPFLVDITDAVRPGKNTLEVLVSNLWVNRLIRDEQFPSDMEWAKKGELAKLPEWFVNNTQRPEKRRKTFTTYRHYNGTEPLVPSGLVGPVSLITIPESSDPLIRQIIRYLFTYSRNSDAQ